MENTLYCGVAKEKITPEKELIPNLRGLQDRHFGGVLDELYLRVIALQNGEEKALLISFDLDKVPHPLKYLTLLSQETGTPKENIFLVAVHTHTAPITGDRPFEKPNDMSRKPPIVQETTKKYEAFLEERLLTAVKSACDKIRPAKMGIGIGDSYINMDRKQWYEYKDNQGEKHRKCGLGVNPAASVDRTVFVIKFEDSDGKPIAFYVNYPVHCCVMHTNECCDGKLGMSGDIGGNVSRFMEVEYPDSVALWCSGAAGDINPAMQNEVYYPDPKTGDMVTRVMQGNNYDILIMLATRHYDDIKRIVAKIKCTEDKVKIKGAVEWSETPGKKESSIYQVRLHLMMLGEIALLGLSGELYSSLARRLQDMMPVKYLVLMNHDASLCTNSGYIFDDDVLLIPEADLPGIGHTNMRPGYFMASLIEHTCNMIKQC